MNELSKKNEFNVDLLTTTPNRYSSFSSKNINTQKFENINVVRFEIPKHQSGILDQSKSFIFYAFSVFKYVSEKKYDLIFASSSRLMTAFLGALISSKKNIRLFLDIRDIFVDTIGDLFKGFKGRIVVAIFSKIEKYTINRAQFLNVVSEGFINYFKKKYPLVKPVFFPNGIDDIFINTDFSIAKTHSRTILYAGNIGFGQGLQHIIPKMAQNLDRRWNIKIVGDGGNKIELIKEVKKLNLRNVTIVDPVIRNELIELYKSSEVLFLHLNQNQAFEKVLPSKIFEYGATGKPILAGVSGYAKKFIDREITNSKTFEPCNYDDAINSLYKLKLEFTDRDKFKKKYARDILSQGFAEEILGSLNNV